MSSPEWQVVNRAKRKWASVWRPIATNPMSLEAIAASRLSHPVGAPIFANRNARIIDTETHGVDW